MIPNTVLIESYFFLKISNAYWCRIFEEKTQKEKTAMFAQTTIDLVNEATKFVTQKRTYLFASFK